MNKKDKIILSILLIGVIICLVVLLSPNYTLAVFSTAAPTPSAAPQIVALTPEQEIVMKDINNYRAKLGLSVALPAKVVCDFAQARAVESVKVFDHKAFLSQTPARGYWTENLAKNYTALEVVSKWIASPTHERNLRANTPYICVAKVLDPQGSPFWVMEGWRP